jgi:hypothetical protein
MVIVEAGVGATRQLHDPLAHGLGQPAINISPIGVSTRSISNRRFVILPVRITRSLRAPLLPTLSSP